MNNADRWAFHLEYDPDRDDPEGWSDEVCAAKVRAAVGTAKPVSIRYRGAWVAVDRVADRYVDGRVVLVGDAAHIMPPWGGFNGNTGIADAQNAAWRLARAARDGEADALLAGYEADRRPVALCNGEQAQIRDDFDLRFGIRTEGNAADYPKMRGGGELLMRYRYGEGDTVDALRTQVGTRFPHAWIEVGGRRRSTLDLLGPEGVALGGPDAVGEVLRAGRDFRFLDEGVDWSGLTADAAGEVVKIRPDGFVGSRRRGDTTVA